MQLLNITDIFSRATVVEIIDIVSPLLTLAFGAYGVLSDAKSSEVKRINKRVVSVTGIVVISIITFIIKLSDYETKLIKADTAAKEKQLQETQQQQFQAGVNTNLTHSIRKLNKISDDNKKALGSLSKLNSEQQTALYNTEKGLAPLFPMRVEISFTLKAKDSKIASNYLSILKSLFSKRIDSLNDIKKRIDSANEAKEKNDTMYNLSLKEVLEEGNLSYVVNPAWLDEDNSSLRQANKEFYEFISHIAFAALIERDDEDSGQDRLFLSISIPDALKMSSQVHTGGNYIKGDENNKLSAEVNIEDGTIRVTMVTNSINIVRQSTDKYHSFYDLQNTTLALYIISDQRLNDENRMAAGESLLSEFKMINQGHFYRSPLKISHIGLTIGTGFSFSKTVSPSSYRWEPVKLFSEDAEKIESCCRFRLNIRDASLAK
jgi:hypothetical protein